MAQVHRFHDKVAVWLDGDTRYLTAEEAIKFGNQMVRYGRDVKARTFLESNVGTFNMDLSDPDNDNQPTYKRVR